MQLFKIRMIWGWGAAIIALLAYAAFWVMGSAVVLDRSGQITSAAVTTGDGRTQPLHALPFGIFYTVPQLEGTIEIRCRNGSQAQSGYVTRHIHTWLRLEAGQGCKENLEVS